MFKRFGLFGLIVGLMACMVSFSYGAEILTTEPTSLNLTIAPGRLDTTNIWVLNLSDSDIKVVAEFDPWILVTPKEFEIPKKTKRQVLTLFMIPSEEEPQREGKIVFKTKDGKQTAEVKVTILGPQPLALVPDEKDLKIAELLQNIEAREKRITGLEKAMEEFSIASYKTLDELKEKIKTKTGKLEEAEKKLQELTASHATVVEKLATEIELLKGERDDRDKMIAALLAEIVELKEKLAPYEAQVAKDAQSTSRSTSLYENLANNLAEEIKQGEVALSVNPDLSVTVFALFPSGSIYPNKQGSNLLTKLGNLLKEKLGPDYKIEVRGFTDSLPIGPQLARKYPTNWELSCERAASVFRILKWRIGINGKCLSIAGYGPSEPVADNSTVEGRGKNRRVEIVVSEGK